jgi:hypothetical protein
MGRKQSKDERGSAPHLDPLEVQEIDVLLDFVKRQSDFDRGIHITTICLACCTQTVTETTRGTNGAIGRDLRGCLTRTKRGRSQDRASPLSGGG